MTASMMVVDTSSGFHGAMTSAYLEISGDRHRVAKKPKVRPSSSGRPSGPVVRAVERRGVVERAVRVDVVGIDELDRGARRDPVAAASG